MTEKLLYFQMQMLQAEIKMRAMVAENQRCKFLDIIPTYREDDFDSIINNYNIHHNAFPFGD